MTLGPFTQWSREEIEKRRQELGDTAKSDFGRTPKAPLGLEQRLYNRAYWAAWGYRIPGESVEGDKASQTTLPGRNCRHCGKPWVDIMVDMSQPPNKWTPPQNNVCYVEVPVCDCGYGEQA